MSAEHEQILLTYPEARQLFGLFGEDYDFEFDKNEDLALDEYMDGNTFVAQGLAEVNELLLHFPDNASMRAALKHLGVKWSMWDQGDDWVPFVRRVQARLTQALADNAN